MNPSEPVKPLLETERSLPKAAGAETTLRDRGNHEPEAKAGPAQPAPKIAGYCRECGKTLLAGSEIHEALGAIYCELHRPGSQIAQDTLTQNAMAQDTLAQKSGRQTAEPMASAASSLAPRQQARRSRAPRIPVGPIVLIVIGVLFLLGNLHIIEIGRLMRYWPVLLIVMGVYMIYARLADSAEGKQNGR